MCGRFVQAHGAEEYAHHFDAELVLGEFPSPSWNVAPTDRVYGVAIREEQRSLGTFRWGLVPWFADSVKVGARHINARAETVATNRVFKDSFERKRCLIPADGFYEWQQRPEGKLPHFIQRTDGTPLGLAGLWASWKDESGERLTTCTIITTAPNGVIQGIHDRMPVIIDPADWGRWLDPTETKESLVTLLTPAPDDALRAYPVSSLVNSVRNNVPELVEPLQ